MPLGLGLLERNTPHNNRGVTVTLKHCVPYLSGDLCMKICIQNSDNRLSTIFLLEHKFEHNR